MRDTRVRAIRSLRQLEIERRQRQRLVVDDLDRGAAVAEHDDRPEGRIVGNAGDQLARLGPQDHRMDGDAGDAGIGHHRARPARISATASRTASSPARSSRTPPTSDLCTMSGDRILRTTGTPLARCGRRRRPPRRGRAPARRARPGSRRRPAGAATRSDRARRAGRERALDHRAAAATSGAKSAGMLGGVAIKASRASR